MGSSNARRATRACIRRYHSESSATTPTRDSRTQCKIELHPNSNLNWQGLLSLETMSCSLWNHTGRRQYLRRLGTIAATLISAGLGGCSNGGSEDGELVTIEEHGRDGPEFYVEVKNGHPVEDTEVTVVLEFLDGSDTVIGRTERRVTIESGTTRRIEFEVQAEDVDGDVEDVASYTFELQGDLTE